MRSEFDEMVVPARRKPALWRLVLGCLLIVAIVFLWFAIEFGTIWLLSGRTLGRSDLAGLTSPETPGMTLLLLSTFIGMAVAPIAAARLLHGRGVGTLFGARRRVWRDFLRAFALVAVLYGVSITFLAGPMPPEPNLSPSLWTILLPISLGLVLIQTGAEELIFRGYLMQQLAARIPWRLIYLVLPSVLFGALHYDPSTSGGNALLIAVAAGIFGLIAADLTYATGSLGAAWGLHFANNVAALLIVATQGTITGLALFVTPYAADNMQITAPLVLAEIGSLLLIWGVLRIWLRR